MKSVIYIVILVLISFGVHSQQFLPQSYDTVKQKNRVVLQGWGFHHSNALKNDITGKFLRGGEIDDEIKSNSLEGHGSKNNSLGGEVYSSIDYFFQPNAWQEKNYGLVFSLGQQLHFASEYNSDLYELVFFGNNNFQNAAANVANTRGMLLDMYKVGGGIFNMENKNYIALNAVFVNDYFRFQSDRGRVFNNVTDNVIDYDLDMYFQQASSHTYFQGMGASIDFDYNLGIQDGGVFDGYIQISGRNLGFVYMDQLEKVGISANGQYSGFNFSNLDLLQEEGIDIADTLGLNRSQENGIEATPGFVQISKITNRVYDHKFKPFFGARFYPTIGYFPMVFLGGQLSFLEHFEAGAQLSYGGYGNLRGGLYVSYQNRNFALSLGTEDVHGAILKSGFGRSALLRIQYSW